MQTTAIGTVAKSLLPNKEILLNCLISNSYIPYTDLHKISRIPLQNKEWLNNNPIEKTFTHSAIAPVSNLTAPIIFPSVSS